MTQWEQIKKEYSEIPIPVDGEQQVLYAIAKAKSKRDSNRHRWKQVVKYATVAAASLLVIFVMPMMLLFSGGLGAAKNEASMAPDCATDTTISEDFCTENAIANNSDRGAAEDTEMKQFADAMAPVYSAGAPEMEETVEEAGADDMPGEFAWDEDVVSEEILRQMEERMQQYGETYYIKSEQYPNGFERIDEQTEYYINDEGLLVIVFAAGTVAPKEQGDVEFVIPAEVMIP